MSRAVKEKPHCPEARVRMLDRMGLSEEEYVALQATEDVDVLAQLAVEFVR